MKKILRLGSSFVLAIVLVLSLSGCQIFHLFWPQNAPVEVSEAIPEIPEEVLKEAAELEEAAELLETLSPDEKSLQEMKARAGYFIFKYELNYESEYLRAESRLVDSITMMPLPNQADYSKAPYYFVKVYKGKQSAEMAGEDAGVICWTMFEHQVEYTVTGTYDPSSCTIKINIEAEPIKTEELGSSCPHYTKGIIDFALLFVPTPEKTITVTRLNTPYTFDQWHKIQVLDFNYPPGAYCPMPIR